jgi:anaerobic dimethyl sulfoxide reductase subunit B (iron-sulfur subunit)
MALKWKRPAFFLDAQICIGCKTCMVACKDKNNLDPGIRWRRVVEYCGGQWVSLPDGTFRQDVFGYYISVSCNHCDNPICVEVCPTGAMNQDENGIVTVDQNRCVGCRYCEWACPYGAPQYNAGIGRMSKCDLCRDELETGGMPACVAACPTRALSLGEFDASLLEFEGHKPIAPLPDEEFTSPIMVIKPHKMGKPINSTAGIIANPEENKDV